MAIQKKHTLNKQKQIRQIKHFVSQYKVQNQQNAKQCLEKGLCDWIITNDGRFINDVKDLKTKQR